MAQRSTLGFPGTPGPAQLRTIAPAGAVAAAADVAAYLSHRNVALYLVSPDRSRRYRVRHWESLEAFHVVHPVGQLKLVAPLTAPWIALAEADSDAFGLGTAVQWWGWSLDLYVRRMTEPLWSGPLIARRLSHDGTAGSARVELTAHTWLYHALWRRAHHQGATMADKTYTAAADNMLLQIIRNNIGNPVVTPSGYVPTRTDFGPDWTFAGAADNSPAQASSISLAEQAGNNLWTVVERGAELGDCYFFVTESPAATFTISVAAPYQRSDLSSGLNGIIIGPQYGTAQSFEDYQSFEETVNQARLKGDGDAASQVSKWYTNSTSQTKYGIFEGERTEHGTPSTTYTDTSGAALVDTQGEPVDTVTMTVRDSAACAFNSDIFMRDLVPWHDPVFDMSGTALIRGWNLKQSGAGAFDLVLTLGDYRASLAKQGYYDLPARGPMLQATNMRSTTGG